MDDVLAPIVAAAAAETAEPLVLDILRTADPRRQQELQARVERIATEHGYRHVYDGWTGGEIERTMALRFAAPPAAGPSS